MKLLNIGVAIGAGACVGFALIFDRSNSPVYVAIAALLVLCGVWDTLQDILHELQKHG